MLPHHKSGDTTAYSVKTNKLKFDSLKYSGNTDLW